MAQAVKLTQETVMLCAVKTGQSTADMQAMYEDAKDRGYDAYVVVDYYGPRGDYVPWSVIRELFFRNYFTFPWGESPNKFESVAAIETNPED
jgi:hypothetical protein